MKYRTHASIEVASTPEAVFDFATSLSNLPKVFLGYGPIPKIIQAEVKDGLPMVEGVVRKVWNSDGSIIDEQLEELKRPHKHKYSLLGGFKPPFSWLVRGGGGEWTFLPSKNGTNITWNFYFELTTPLVYPLATVILGVLFSQAQHSCLTKIKEYVENGV